MEHVEQGTPIPSFRTPRIIIKEAFITFSLAAVGIKIISPLTKDNHDSITKTIEENPFPREHPTFLCAGYTSRNG